MVVVSSQVVDNNTNATHLSNSGDKDDGGGVNE
jgi:hypothetical protein